MVSGVGRGGGGGGGAGGQWEGPCGRGAVRGGGVGSACVRRPLPHPPPPLPLLVLLLQAIRHRKMLKDDGQGRTRVELEQVGGWVGEARVGW